MRVGRTEARVYKERYTSQTPVAYICHPKLHRRLRSGASEFQANQGKKSL
jgi:hypothetical protein